MPHVLSLLWSVRICFLSKMHQSNILVIFTPSCICYTSMNIYNVYKSPFCLCCFVITIIVGNPKTFSNLSEAQGPMCTCWLRIVGSSPYALVAWTFVVLQMTGFWQEAVRICNHGTRDHRGTRSKSSDAIGDPSSWQESIRAPRVKIGARWRCGSSKPLPITLYYVQRFQSKITTC